LWRAIDGEGAALDMLIQRREGGVKTAPKPPRHTAGLEHSGNNSYDRSGRGLDGFGTVKIRL